jgi:hypothetical protein
MKTKQILLLLAIGGSTARGVWGATYSVTCPNAGVTYPFALQVYAVSGGPNPNGEDLNTVLNTSILPDFSQLLIPTGSGACPSYTVYVTDSSSPSGWDDVNLSPLLAAPRMKPGDGAFFQPSSPVTLTFSGFAYGAAGEPAEPTPPAVPAGTWRLRARQIPSPATSVYQIVPATVSGFAMYFGWSIAAAAYEPGPAPQYFNIFQRPTTASWVPFQPTPSASPLNVGVAVPVWVGPVPGTGGCTPAVISGAVWDDLNQDTIKQANEPGLPNQQVNLSGTTSLTAFTASDGSYSFVVPPGNYTIGTVLPSCLKYTIPTPFPNQWQVNGVLEGQLFNNKNFGTAPLTTSGCSDLFVRVYATYPFLAGHQYTAPCNNNMVMHYRIFCRNNCGHLVCNAKVTFVKPSTVNWGAWFATGPGVTLSGTAGSTRTWKLPCLAAGAAVTIDQAVLISPAVVLNSWLVGTATIFPTAGDCFPADNTSTYSAQVTCSFDPNDKTVSPKGCGPEGYIPGNQTLTYQVHFQNVGSGPAFNVVVHDQLDANLDASTLMLLDSSHNYVFSMNGRDMVWTFPDIYLPDSTDDEPGSNGFLTYSVRPLAGLAAGTMVTNQAAVYFDLNAPVFTPTTTNTISSGTIPTASFVVSPWLGSANITNDFVYTGGATGASFVWDFGPDAIPPTSTNMNPAGVVFPIAGEQNVSLLVSQGGCDSTPATATIAAGLPSLDAELSDGQICLTWLGNGYTLEETASLLPPVNWQTVQSPVTVVGDSSFACVPTTNSFRFYRLHD